MALQPIDRGRALHQATRFDIVRKLIIDMDPGIGDAVAAVLALLDPELDVLALTATAGCVPGAVASRNVQAVVSQLDPSKWPRIGCVKGPAQFRRPEHESCAELVESLNGPTGLGDLELVVPELHHRHESFKILIDEVKANPQQVTLLTLGPLTNVAAACERAPEFLELLAGWVCLGGAISEPGDISAVAEMNIALDPESARTALGSPHAKTLIPLDVTNRVVINLDHFSRILGKASRAGEFLGKLLPYSFRAHHQVAGMEGIRLREITALAAVARPHLFKVKFAAVDVELRGELTRGMTVVDRRQSRVKTGNAHVATEVDAQGVIDYLTQLIRC